MRPPVLVRAARLKRCSCRRGRATRCAARWAADTEAGPCPAFPGQGWPGRGRRAPRGGGGRRRGPGVALLESSALGLRRVSGGQGGAPDPPEQLPRPLVGGLCLHSPVEPVWAWPGSSQRDVCLEAAPTPPHPGGLSVFFTHHVCFVCLFCFSLSQF